MMCIDSYILKLEIFGSVSYIWIKLFCQRAAFFYSGCFRIRSAKVGVITGDILSKKILYRHVSGYQQVHCLRVSQRVKIP
jgi:hypothetical protein